MHYWSNVKKVLEKTIGAEYIITGVPGLVSMSFILTNEVQWQLHLGLALWLLERKAWISSSVKTPEDGS